MKKIVTIFILTILTSLNVYTFSGEGSGTEEDPYQITDVYQLQEIQDDLTAHYIIMNDIDASDTRNWNIGDHDDNPDTPDSAMGFVPISPDIKEKFRGVLNGNGFTISNLYINRPVQEYVGIISFNDGSIYKLSVNDCYIFGRYFVGGLVSINNGIINESNTSGIIIGLLGGGLTNSNNGSICNSYSNAEIIAEQRAGGLAAENEGIIINSYFTGKVSGGQTVGGLAGSNRSATYTASRIFNIGLIAYSYSTGTVTGKSSVGALVGVNHSIVHNSYWDIEKSNIDSSDGGEGKTTAEMKNINTYLQSGWNFDFIWKINGDYPFIEIDSSYCPVDSDNDGFLNIATLNHLYWLSESGCVINNGFELDNDIDASGTRDRGFGFLPIGMHMGFKGNIEGNGHLIKNLYMNFPGSDGIGFLTNIDNEGCSINNFGLENIEIYANDYTGGITGCFLGDTITISDFTCTGLIHGGNNVGGIAGDFSMSGTLMLSNAHLDVEIVGERSVGGITGHGYTGSISNTDVTAIIIGTENVGGLIGYGIYDISYSGFEGNVSGENSVGGIAGQGGNKMMNCRANANISGESQIGGLIGSFNYRGFILNSCSLGEVSCKYCGGGLIGANGYYILNSYSTAAVAGDSLVGGIAGINKSYISYSYATGKLSGKYDIGGCAGMNLGTISDCFWDIQSSGIDSSAGGNGKTTKEMQQKTTFTEAGWNFDFIWEIDTAYPYIEIDSSYRPIDSDGDGSLNIATLMDLRWLSESCCDLDKDWELSNDIEAGETQNWHSGLGFSPIPDFSGTFNGNNYTISNLTINRQELSYIGFFSSTNPMSEIGDINFEGSYILGCHYVGTLAGRSYGNINSVNIVGEVKGNNKIGGICGRYKGEIISNAKFSGDVTGAKYIGGLIGLNDGCVIESGASGNIKGEESVGGLFGETYSKLIRQSFFSGDVYGNTNVGGCIGYGVIFDMRHIYTEANVYGIENVGGICGAMYGGYDVFDFKYTTIKNTYSNSNVEGISETGGFIGYGQYITIEQSYSAGEIKGETNVAGFMGSCDRDTIRDCYFKGKIEGKENVGGFIATCTESSVYNSYSTGSISGENILGGFVSVLDTSSIVESCFWDTTTSTLDSSAAGTGQPSEAMRNISVFLDSLWDFDSTWAIYPTVNDGYPYLQWQEVNVSVNESLNLNTPQIKIFPNPATDNINIILPKEAEVNFIRISDISGREVKNVSVNSYANNISMNISDLPQGFYIINLYSDGEVNSCAFVVE